MKRWKACLLSAAIALGVGGTSALLSRQGMERYQSLAVQPPLSPPMWLFPVVWSILYILMGIGAAQVWQAVPGRDRSRGLNLYVTQLAVNFFWSLLFFNAQAYGFAALWLALLLALVLGMAAAFRKVRPVAAKLQIPYLLWLAFALYLNMGVWYLN